MPTENRSAVQSRLSQLATNWTREAEARARRSASDSGAELLRSCATEMLAELRDASDADEEIACREYAALHGKSLSTVRRWCQLGLIPCNKRGNSYVIRRGEPCPVFRTSQAA